MAVVLAVLAAVVVVIFGTGDAGLRGWCLATTSASAVCCKAAGLLFFAFAGYARIATLVVRDPARTIPFARSRSG